jgi:hypothetical protein
MTPEELRHALRHCRGAHGWSSRRLSAASNIPPNNDPLSHVAKYRSRPDSSSLVQISALFGVQQHLAAHARRLDAAVTDAARVAAALLATRLSGGRLASPFTAREVYRNESTGLTELRGVQGALECLEELGWIRAKAVRVPDGGRPSVRFHIFRLSLLIL